MAHLVAATQSFNVMTWYPLSYAARMVLSTQQLVKKPPRTMVVMPR